MTSIHKRFGCKRDMPYDYDVAYLRQGDVELIWDLEKKLHKIFKHKHYQPHNKFKGSVKECFIDLDTDSTIKTIEELILLIEGMRK